MNKNIKLKNKGIIEPAIRKDKEKGKLVIIPDVVFANNENNSSAINDNKTINKKALSEQVALLELENEKLKKKVEQLEEKIEELQEEIELDEKYYEYK